MKNDDLDSIYKKDILRKYYIGIILLVILIIMAIIDIKVGAMDLSWNDIVIGIFDRNAPGASVLWNLRLLRIFIAIVVGFCMGIEGCIMQSTLRNPLASPYTMGISQGAGFGVAFAVVVLGAGNFVASSGGYLALNNPFLTTIFAFIGSILAIVLILILSKIKSITPTTMILSGMAISSLFSAGTMLIQYFADSNQLSVIVFWTFGDLERVVWNEFWIVLIVFVPCLLYFLYHQWDYNALETGEETVRGLGINTDRLRLRSLVISSLTASVCVSFVGVIGFVGLIAPHIMKRLIGVNHKYLIPYSAGLGAVVLLMADIGSRIILAPIILPIGILTSFLGVPIFMYVIIKSND